MMDRTLGAEKCAVCEAIDTVAEMTDGRNRAYLCDQCRPLVVALFHVFGSLPLAVSEVQIAKGQVVAFKKGGK